MNNTTDLQTDNSVVAIGADAKGHLPLRAVKLKKTGGGPELLWSKTSDPDQTTFKSFFKTLPIKPPTEDKAACGDQTIIAVDSSIVSFYRFEIPAVDDKQANAIVKMQLESLLPLSAEQMQTAWRIDGAVGEQKTVTAVAARTSQLQNIVKTAESSRASKVLLDSEGLVKAWTQLFEGTGKKSVIINIGQKNSRVILTENNKLIHAVTLDIGNDYFDTSDDYYAACELFSQDLRNTLDLFGTDAEDVQIYLLVEEPAQNEQLIDYFNSAGLKVGPAVLDMQNLSCPEGITSKDVFRNLDLVATALLALDADGTELTLFDNIYQPHLSAKGPKPIVALKQAAVFAAVILVVFLFISKAIDKSTLAKLKNTDVNQLIAMQDTRKKAAGERHNVLRILKVINESGMVLETFTFQKDRPVAIASTASSLDQLYEFEKKLKTQKGIANVTILSPTTDQKTKKVKFKMTFHYQEMKKAK